MKMKKLMTVAAAILVSASAAMAEEVTVVHVWNDPGQWWGRHWVYSTADLYTPCELSLDGFATFTAAEEKIENVFSTNIRSGKWGGGVGLNYFFTRELGIGGDINMPGDGGKLVHNGSGSLIARFPIPGSGLAPYVFGGGGRLVEPTWQWEGHAGVGLEFRFNPVTGVFGDARYIWADKTQDELLIRTGLRFVF